MGPNARLTAIASCAAAALTLASACGDDDVAPATDSGTARDSRARLDGGGVDAAAGSDAQVDAPIVPVDAGPPRDPLDGIGSVELVDDGYMFLEGPQWIAADGALLFSDIPADTIYRLALPSTVTPFRNPSDNSNGLAVDTMGRLLAAEHGARRVSRTRADGSRETVADRYMGDRLNSPNDLVVRSDGTIYFTDPPYGLVGAREVPFNGVYRVAPDGTLFAEVEGDATATRPNGVALSPDEHVLYVADSQRGLVTRYDVAADGSLGGEGMFTMDTPGADGMAMDTAGNLYVSTSGGVMVLAPHASSWGTIDVPMQPANCAFGGADARTLFITARQALYRVDLTIAGVY